jgi:hypothetical protein
MMTPGNRFKNLPPATFASSAFQKNQQPYLWIDLPNELSIEPVVDCRRLQRPKLHAAFVNLPIQEFK